MHLRVSSPGHELRDGEVDRIQRDLEKIDRRLKQYGEVYTEVRIHGGNGAATQRHVTLEVEYGRNHLVASADGELGQAVRKARDEIVRQINDRSRRGHSEYSKGR